MKLCATLLSIHPSVFSHPTFFDVARCHPFVFLTFSATFCWSFRLLSQSFFHSPCFATSVLVVVALVSSSSRLWSQRCCKNPLSIASLVHCFLAILLYHRIAFWFEAPHFGFLLFSSRAASCPLCVVRTVYVLFPFFVKSLFVFFSTSSSVSSFFRNLFSLSILLCLSVLSSRVCSSFCVVLSLVSPSISSSLSFSALVVFLYMIRCCMIMIIHIHYALL